MEAINIPLLTQYAIWINTLAPGDAIKPRHQRANLLLRAMLDYAPTEDGRAYIEQQVIECAGDNYKEKLALLSEHFIHSLLTPLKSLGGRTPAPSSRVSGPEEQLERDTIATDLLSGQRSSKMKERALIRDGHKCLITGKVDIPSCKRRLVPEADLNLPRAPTEGVHILPFSLMKHTTSVQIDNSAMIWVILQNYAGIELNELNGPLINRIENIMTVERNLHPGFGKMEWWLNPVPGEPNKYTFEALDPMDYDIGSDRPIEFVTSTAIPLPSPRYLALHAACAKVCQISGAGEIIDEYVRKWEDMAVLSEDGSSAEFLHQALSASMVAVH